VAGGSSEVVLTGVDIASYGGDLPGQPRLGQMVRRLLRTVPELPRLRLSSLDPAAIDDDLLHCIADEQRLMPHLHLSLQAGDDLILKRMKRRHSRAEAIHIAETFRRLRPDVVLGADLIAGFPTEDAAMFENTAALIADCGLTYLHVFPYSQRRGTPAARIPNQVPVATRKARAQRLRALGAAALDRYLHSRVGGTARVLVETPSLGHCEHFAPVAGAAGSPGDIVATRITGVADGRLIGSPL
jgi:threonylcarbamoyladenosine tRNA methylthiotransferase MtaB